MVSDVLAEAIERIREYLNDPAYVQIYQGKLRVELERVLDEMERLRVRLDQPPAQKC